MIANSVRCVHTQTVPFKSSLFNLHPSELNLRSVGFQNWQLTVGQSEVSRTLGGNTISTIISGPRRGLTLIDVMFPSISSAGEGGWRHAPNEDRIVLKVMEPLERCWFSRSPERSRPEKNAEIPVETDPLNSGWSVNTLDTLATNSELSTSYGVSPGTRASPTRLSSPLSNNVITTSTASHVERFNEFFSGRSTAVLVRLNRPVITSAVSFPSCEST
mmetsp:Transcript_6656/g.16285  ORF Transcript_6656/g.16285 Transcript_6656/m.16285 type:complete len:217 (-) Transcript_6656:2927-3577(-)